MDIIITGAQGTGKVSTAHKLIAAHFGVDVIYKVTLGQLYIVGHLAIKRTDVIAASIRMARVEAVLFDQLPTAADLLMALAAVKAAREQTGRDLYAIYIHQSDGLLTMAKYPNNIKNTQDLFLGEETPTLNTLEKLAAKLETFKDAEFIVRQMLDHFNATALDTLQLKYYTSAYEILSKNLRYYEKTN